MSSSLGTQAESSERTQRAAEADPDDDKEKLAQPNFDTVQFTFRMPFGENSLPEPDISSAVELSSDQDRYRAYFKTLLEIFPRSFLRMCLAYS